MNPPAPVLVLLAAASLASSVLGSHGLAPPSPAGAAPAPTTNTSPSATASPTTPRIDEDFETHVRPLLSSSCFDCHGPDKQKSGLRVDSLAGLLEGGERGPALVPGAPEDSLLLRAIRWEDHDLAMPPRERLDAAAVDEVERWIAAGAPVSSDFERAAPSSGAVEAFDLEARLRAWAYQPLAQDAPPSASPETHPVDAFLGARMAEVGVVPNPPADPAVLLRRVHFDLTGLPPAAETVEAFLADPSDAAYEDVVDALLASPAYGEHWARTWLDLMRYAESRGHEFDYDHPNAWRYRDYLVRALNADVPYERFVLEHVAGDLVPEPRLHPEEGWNESVLATGSWTLGEEVHSPVDLRGDQVERVANQVDVLSKAFLGLTVACARCHDHKFDPVPTEDYYALAGYALSSSHRQVRFESSEVNARVMADLAAATDRHAPDVVRELAATWAREADEVARSLALAGAVWASDPATHPELPEPAGAQRADLVLEDFEGADWGAWTVTGDAFGPGPLRLAQLPGHMGPVDAIGSGFVNSYAPLGSDRPQGTLTGPAFEVTRHYLRFRVGGGDRLDTIGVRLELRQSDETWKVAAAATGTRSNRMVERFWDLRRYEGETARVVVYDEDSGSWGQVGVDQLVLSDWSEPDGVRVERAARRRLLLHAGGEALAAGLDPTRVRAAIELLELARERPHDPLHGLATGTAAAPRRGGSRGGPFSGPLSGPALDPETEVLFDWGALGGADWPAWRVNGPTFGLRPRSVGEVQLGGSPADPVTRVVALPGPHAEVVWDGLALAPGTERAPSSITWMQAGRTLRTDSFVVPDQPLWYLVQGSVDAFAEVGGHRMVKGPLWAEVVLRDGGAGLRWVRHDLTDLAGHVGHVEFSARAERAAGEPPFALHAVVAAAAAPPLPIDGPLPRERFDALLAGPDAGGTAELAEALRAATEGLATGTLRPAQALLADWMAGSAPLLSRAAAAQPAGVQALAPWLDAVRKASAEARFVSATAPALWDGSGVDEAVLIRGSHSTPGAPAPRRAPLCVGGGAMPAAGAESSGRLALARRLVAQDNPLFARVQVNRLWHHLFGRGLVATVDNFGVLGEPPTHPALLDWLAREFLAQGTSNKRMLRLLVTSDAYRRSSTPRPDLADVDGANRLWHRTQVRRLSGEALRDAILATSGRLDDTRFGEPIPIPLTQADEARGKPQISGPIDGEGRRSLYLSVRRNFPYAFFDAFDRPKPTTAVGRRNRSNVPAQALSLLNDPFVHGQAELWAARLREAERDPEARLARLFLTAFGRPATPEELEASRSFLSSGPEEGPADDEVLWTDLAHVLLNAKEFSFVR